MAELLDPNTKKPVEGTTKEVLEASKKLNWIISYDPTTKKVDLGGPLQNIGDFYAAVEIAKDIIKEWNKLNNGYLKFEKAPAPKGGIMNFVKGKAK